MKFSCPNCDQRIEATEQDAGTSADCPSCGEALLVPSSEEEPLEVYDEPERTLTVLDGKERGFFKLGVFTQIHITNHRIIIVEIARIRWWPLVFVFAGGIVGAFIPLIIELVLALRRRRNASKRTCILSHSELIEAYPYARVYWRKNVTSVRHHLKKLSKHIRINDVTGTSDYFRLLTGGDDDHKRNTNSEEIVSALKQFSDSRCVTGPDSPAPAGSQLDPESYRAANRFALFAIIGFFVPALNLIVTPIFCRLSKRTSGKHFHSRHGIRDFVFGFWVGEVVVVGIIIVIVLLMWWSHGAKTQPPPLGSF